MYIYIYIYIYIYQVDSGYEYVFVSIASYKMSLFTLLELGVALLVSYVQNCVHVSRDQVWSVHSSCVQTCVTLASIMMILWRLVSLVSWERTSRVAEGRHVLPALPAKLRCRKGPLTVCSVLVKQDFCFVPHNERFSATRK